MDTTPCSSSNIASYNPSATGAHVKSSSRSSAAKAAASTSVAGPEGTDSLVAVLDSCGSVKFSVFSFYTVDEETGFAARNASLFARSVTTKVPAANASGVSNARTFRHHLQHITSISSLLTSNVAR